MKTADEMRTITKEIIAKEMAEKHQRACVYIEERVAPRIEAAAKEGNYSTSYMFDSCIDLDAAIGIFRDNGYATIREGLRVTILWQ